MNKDELEKIEAPLLPPHIRSFVIEYVTATRKVKTESWAKRFNVHAHTIDLWLKRKDVKEYMRYILADDNAYIRGASQKMLKRALKVSMKLLTTHLTEDNMDKLSRFTLGILQLYKSGIMNVQPIEGETDNEEAQRTMRTIKEIEKMSIEELREGIQEFEKIDEMLDKKSSGLKIAGTTKRRPLRTIENLEEAPTVIKKKKKGQKAKR